MIKNNRNLILYLFGNNSSIFGDIILTTTLALHIVIQTNSPKAFASILALSFAPKFVFSIFSGSIVDRLDKKKLMIFLDLFRGVMLISMLFIPEINITIITVLILTFSIADTFFIPASVSIIPRLFVAKKLSHINGIDQSLRNVLNVLSPLLASILYVTGGIKIVLLVDGITFLLSAMSEVFFTVEKQSHIIKNQNIISDLVDGIHVIFKDKRIVSLMLNGTLTHLFLFSFIEVGMISLVLIVFEAPEAHYGIIQSAISIGSIFSSIIAISVRNKRELHEHINIGIIGMLVSVIFFVPLVVPGFIQLLKSTSLGPVIFLSFACAIMYFSFGYYIVFYRSFYQTHVPKAYLGRYSSLFMMMISLARIIGVTFFGRVFESANIMLAISILGLGMLLKLFIHIPFVKEERKLKKASEILLDT